MSALHVFNELASPRIKGTQKEMLEELRNFLLVNMQTYNLPDQVEGPLKKGR